MQKKVFIQRNLFVLFIACLSIFLFIFPNKILKSKFFVNSGYAKRQSAKIFLANLKSEHLKDVKENLFNEKNKSNITFIVNNNQLNFQNGIYNYQNRLYLPVDEILSYLGYKVILNKNKAVISNEYQNISVNLNKSTFKKDNVNKHLRGEHGIYNNHLYLSLIDINEIANLKCSWNTKNNSITLFKRKLNDQIKEIDFKKEAKSSEKKYPSFIRLEDVVAGTVYLNDDNLEKFRAIGDFLERKGQRFHIAWIPRYVDPKNKIDNDLANNISPINTEFLYSLDYAINRGGILGLHGYTHQYGNEVSVIGSEFTEENHLSAKQERERVQEAIKDAVKLNLPYKFFETPHYRSSQRFQSMLEEYFNYVYEPCIGLWNKNIITSRRNNLTKFIPAPLGYVEDRNVQDMINKIRNNKSETVTSFFYHPSKEFDDILVKRDEAGYPYCDYKETSMLKALLKELNKDGYFLESITCEEDANESLYSYNENN